MHEKGTSRQEPVVYVIDDDVSVRESIQDLLASVGLRAKAFESTQQFCSSHLDNSPACLVLDVRMPGQSGMEFHRQLIDQGINLPVVFITGHGDIAMGIQAMKNGAIEFLTKPFRDQDLLDAIQRAIAIDSENKRKAESLEKIKNHWNALSAGEQDVARLVVEGLLNKQIAARLGLSEITVKVRRANVMRKMQAKSLVDLVRLMDRLDE